ncbi:MAG: 50S ribosomal protein L3 [Planctomycetota bacterium]|jgi:large subunit ribosomal protein L3|nr:50S ribosomal protein L3 [Planctomycetota bacterium]
MIQGILARKVGMTQRFEENGTVVPVTVLEAGPCPVLMVRTAEKDGYQAVQLGLGSKKPKNVSKPMLGHFAKANATPQAFVREVPVQKVDDIEVGQSVTVSIFEAGETVNVTGNSKGRGFQGTIKRHGFSRGPMTHGSRNKRRPGSIGQCADPAKVFKGKRMPGQMGNHRVTRKGLSVVEVDEERNLLLLRGSVPGPSGGYIIVRKGYTSRSAR